MTRMHSIRAYTLTTAIVLAAALAAPARDWHVATSGSDQTGDGAADKPFRTVARGVAAANGSPGTVHIAAGTYIEAYNLSLDPGVSIVGEGIGKTVLSSNNTKDWTTIFRLNGGSGNQTISGLTILGNDRAVNRGIAISERSNVAVKNVRIKDIEAAAVSATSNTGDTFDEPDYITGIRLENITIENSGKFHGSWSGGAMEISGLDGCVITGITIRCAETNAYGIKFKGGGFYKNLTISNCDIEVTTHVGSGLWSGSGASIELWNCMGNIVIENNDLKNWVSLCGGRPEAGEYTVIVRNNRITGLDKAEPSLELALTDAHVHHNTFVNPGGYGIASWWTGGEGWACPAGYYGDHLIHHNVFVGREGTQKQVMLHLANGKLRNIKFYNNTGYNLQRAFFLQADNAGNYVRDIEIRNNLIIKVADGVFNYCCKETSVLEGFRIDHNVFHQINEDLLHQAWNATAGQQALADNVVADPKVDLDAQSSSFLHPTSASTVLIDEGVDVGLSYAGAAPEIGAMEIASTGIAGHSAAQPPGLAAGSSPSVHLAAVARRSISIPEGVRRLVIVDPRGRVIHRGDVPAERAVRDALAAGRTGVRLISFE